MCDVEINLSPLSIQQKYVNIYNAMLENQRGYEQRLDDLKLTIDGYLDVIKNSTKENINIGGYIIKTDMRNRYNKSLPFKGLSMENYFIDPIVNETGLDFSSYKSVFPGEFACSLTKIGRDCRSTVVHNTSAETYLISPAYYPFKLEKIDASYFMEYVSRKEFERRAWFSCDTTTRRNLTWEEFCQLKIPKITKNERSIVSNLYNTYIMRNNINE